MEIPYYLVLINLIVWNICFFMSFDKFKKSRHSLSIYNGHSSERAFKIIFLLFLIYSLWTFFGGDVVRYEDFVKGGYEDAYVYEHYFIEPFYVWVASISHNSYLLWKFYVYGLAILLTCITTKVLKLDSYITLLCFTLCALDSYGSTRGVLAYSAFLCGFACVYVKKWWNVIIGLLLLAGSMFLHSTMILPILLAPLTFFTKLNKRSLAIMLLLFPVVVYLVGKIPEIVGGGYFDFADQAVYKFEGYNERAEENGPRSSHYGSFLSQTFQYLGWLFFIPIIFLCVRYAISNKEHSPITRIAEVSFYLVYISLAFYFSTLPIKQIAYARYFTMAPFFFYIAIPECIYACKNNKKFFHPLMLIGWIKVNFGFLMFMYQAWALQSR